MDGIAFISQQQVLKSQQGVKPAVKLSAMEFVRRAVYCTFKRSFAHGPVLKPSQTKPNLVGNCSLQYVWKPESHLYPAGYSELQYDFDFLNYAGIHRPVQLVRDFNFLFFKKISGFSEIPFYSKM